MKLHPVVRIGLSALTLAGREAGRWAEGIRAELAELACPLRRLRFEIRFRVRQVAMDKLPRTPNPCVELA